MVHLREVTANGGLYGSFRDASPDYWGRLVISADAKVLPDSLSEVDFLMAANATRVGNLDFRLSPEDPEPGLVPPHFSRLAQVYEAAGKLQTGEHIDNHLLQLLRQGSSMGGARPKCTVEWEDALWIAKFPAEGDTLNIPRLEYATMTLARRCGIKIPDVRLIKVGGKDVFFIHRFDREKVESGWLRHGFVSALSLIKWDERERLRWDYAALADVMRRYMTASDIAELFRRMVFNILVRNTDDHPRNHGFVVFGQKMTLSPAYDIVPASAQPGVGTDFRLAMSVGEQGREATLENALSRCPRFGLSKGKAQAIVAQLLETTGSWREHFSECGFSGREMNLLAPSFVFGKEENSL